MTDKILFNELLASFKNSLGEERAKSLFQEVASELGFCDKTDFNEEEAVMICNHLQRKSGFIGVLATIVLTRQSKR